MDRILYKPFFTELLLDVLFSFILLAIILQLLAQAHFLEKDSAVLTKAIDICQEAAIFYNEEYGNMEQIEQKYPSSIALDNRLIIYLSADFLYCNREAAAYYLFIEDNHDDTANIRFYESNADIIYAIEGCVLQQEVPVS